jgi:hypothetical protein
VHAAAAKATSTHAATMKSTTAAAEPTTAAAATGKGIIWSKACGDQDESCYSSEDESKHGVPPLFGLPCTVEAMCA